MAYLVLQYWPWMLAALVIGLATAWWVWGRGGNQRSSSIADGPESRDAPLIDPPTEVEAADLGRMTVETALPAAALAKRTPEAPAGDDIAPLSHPKIAPAVGEPDNLLLIKGIGPKLNTLLSDLGITRFDQIAAWTSGDIAEVDQYLGNFKGRIARDNWVEQAGLLADNDIAAFEAKFGKL